MYKIYDSWPEIAYEAYKSDNVVVFPVFNGMEGSKPKLIYYLFFTPTKDGIYDFFNFDKTTLKHTRIRVGNPKPPTPEPPSPRLQIIVGPLKNLTKDKHAFASYFQEMARAIQSPQVTNTNQIRQVNVTAGKIMFQRYQADPRLSPALEAVVQAELTLKNQPLTPELRLKAVDLFNALAWGISQ